MATVIQKRNTDLPQSVFQKTDISRRQTINWPNLANLCRVSQCQRNLSKDMMLCLRLIMEALPN